MCGKKTTIGIAALMAAVVTTVLYGADSVPQTKPAASAKVRVLILDGFSNHNWKLNTKLLRGLLEPTGLFDVSVSTCPRGNSPE